MDDQLPPASDLSGRMARNVPRWRNSDAEFDDLETLLAEAVRKMTSLPAQKFGLWDRGLVRPGLAADLVVFDAETILDRATHEEPEQEPAGLPHVIVNGTFAVRDGRYTGARAGRVLRAR